MSLQQLKETSARWNCLSKVDLLGSLDFWTLTISLDALEPRDTVGLTVADLRMPKDTCYDMVDYERRKKTLVLAAHEYTHFIDATSTIWGMNHLRNLDACFTVPDDNEREFFQLKNTHDHVLCIRLPEYYTVVEKGVAPTRPWESAVTSGVMFTSNGHVGDRPIHFLRFWNASGQPIVRSPISVVSLLEASAMAKEIEVRRELVKRLEDGERLVEEKLLSKEMLDYIYNPAISEYSACFHLVANLQDQSDVSITAFAAGYLARLVLNMPAVAFRTASKNLKAYTTKVQVHESSEVVTRLKLSLEQKNHGAMFVLLSILLNRGALASLSNFYEAVETTLRSIGLSREKLSRAAGEEASECIMQLSNSGSVSLRSLAGAGYHNFRKLNGSDLSYPLEQLALPPALHGDMSPYIFAPGDQNLLGSYDLEEGYNELVQGQLRAENFAEACL